MIIHTIHRNVDTVLLIILLDHNISSKVQNKKLTKSYQILLKYSKFKSNREFLLNHFRSSEQCVMIEFVHVTDRSVKTINKMKSIFVFLFLVIAVCRATKSKHLIPLNSFKNIQKTPNHTILMSIFIHI